MLKLLTGLSPIKLIGIGVGILALIGLVLTINGWRVSSAERKAKLETICQATRDASNLPKLSCKEVPAQIKFLGEALNAVAAKTAQAKIDDAAHAREVEAQHDQASKESSHDYQAELTRARAAYAELVRRNAARGTDQGGRGLASVSGAAPTAAGSGATTTEGRLPPADALTATEQALQLQAILDWGKKVGVVAR